MEEIDVFKLQRWRWWESRRGKYNKGLIISGITAFFTYCIVGQILIASHRHEELEITLFTSGFQAIGYFVMMGIANLCYFMGYFADRSFNPQNEESYRISLFKFGYWFSFALPFTIPLLVFIEYI